jgi:hypothetical protein
MFRNCVNSFLSEDAITQLGSLQFSKSLETPDSVRQTTTTTLNMSRDMAKALIQQFLWTRLIENSVESQNRTYRDKGIWRLNSKGLCVLQEFCTKKKIDIGRFVNHVDASARLIFLIRIERLLGNDHLNCKMEYLTCLFTIMIASLPLRHNYNNSINDNISNTSSMQYISSRYLDSYSEDGHYVCSSDSELSNSSVSRGSTFSDYFPHIQVLPNDLLVGVSYRYPKQFNLKQPFQQQGALLQNMNPSSNKFKMRAIFSSLVCCDWLVEYCTVASNDEAESIMTEFLSLGWITFYEERYRYKEQVESSKSIALNLTGDGIKVVVDVSLEKYNELRLRQQQQAENDSREKRYFFASSSSSNQTDDSSFSCKSSTFTYLQRDDRSNSIKPKVCLPALLHTNSLFASSLCDFGFSSTYFDFKTSVFSTELSTTLYVTQVPMKSSPVSSLPRTPDSPAPSFNGISNLIRLKIVLNDVRYRSLFRDFLDNDYCVENLDFWIDYDNFHRSCRSQMTSADMSFSVQRQLLEGVYVLWEMYLKPGVSRELNVEDKLRKDMAEEISLLFTLNYASSRPAIVISSHSTYESLMTILSWFDKVHDQICRLMASDSITKFIRAPEYKHLVLEIQQKLQEQEEHRCNQSFKKMTQLSIASSDFDEFPPPPQRKLKETIYL